MNNEIAQTVRSSAREVNAAADRILSDALDGRPLDALTLELYAKTLRVYAVRIAALTSVEHSSRTRLVG